MRSLVLVSSFVAVVAVVVVAGCSSPSGPCGASNCGTCCKADGTCAASVSAQTCGVAGNTCNTCDTGFVCNTTGTCVRGATGGGSAGAGGSSGGTGGSSGGTGGNAGGRAGGSGGAGGSAGSSGGGTGGSGGGAPITCPGGALPPAIPISFPPTCTVPTPCGGNPSGTFNYTAACIGQDELAPFKNGVEQGCGVGSVNIYARRRAAGLDLLQLGQLCRTVQGSVTISATVGGAVCPQFCSIVNSAIGQAGFTGSCVADAACATAPRRARSASATCRRRIRPGRRR